MSFIASMVTAAAGGGLLGAAAGASASAVAGAGLGAGVSALTGGDVGEGALMGGIGGLASGAVGALGPAFQGGEVASKVGEQAIQQGTQQVAQEGVNQAAQQAVQQGAQQVAQEGVNQTAQQVAQKSAEQLAQEGVSQTAQQGAGFAGLGPQGTSVVPTTAPNSLGVAGNQSAANMLGQQSVMNSSSGGISTLPGQPGFVGPPATPDQIANASAYTDANMGTRFLADLTGQQGNIVGNTGLKMAGGALQGGVMNAGINGLVAGAQGQDVGEAMGKGALTGAVGGAAGAGLASMAGSGGTLGSIGNFAAKHDVLVPAALSMGANMALGNIIPDASSGMPESSPLKSKYRWNPDAYNAYLPRGNSFGSFAAGGITDLDNYDQAPQMQNPGTLDIPNRNEVANNQGYMGDSVQMMAKGGLSYGGGGILGNLPGANLMQSVYNTTLGDVISPDLKDFLFGTPDDQLSPEQRRKKAELMRQEGASKGMAHGGISDLGGYSDGGRLLKGPGTGVSDDIPATIEGKQPARLAANEFVIPSRIVSEIGNGSTDAGAKALYAMMDRVQNDRKKSIGKGKFAVDSKASRHLDAL